MSYLNATITMLKNPLYAQFLAVFAGCVAFMAAIGHTFIEYPSSIVDGIDAFPSYIYLVSFFITLGVAIACGKNFASKSNWQLLSVSSLGTIAGVFGVMKYEGISTVSSVDDAGSLIVTILYLEFLLIPAGCFLGAIPGLVAKRDGHVNIQRELAQLMIYAGGVAKAIRLSNAVSSKSEASFAAMNKDVMWLAESLHHFDRLGFAVANDDTIAICASVDYLLDSFEGYRSTGAAAEKYAFEKFKRFLVLDDAINVLLKIKAKTTDIVLVEA